MTLAKAQIGDVVTRNRRFTESFVEGEEHTVQRVSDCGHYIWVGGHRHKVPVKYFNLIRRVKNFKVGDVLVYKGTDIKCVVHDVSECGTKFRKVGNLGQGFISMSEYRLAVMTPSVIAEPPELTDFSEQSFTHAPANANGEDCGRVAGDNPHGCGLVAKTEPVETQEQYRERTGYRKFKSGDSVKHNQNSSRVLVVELVSGCGYKFRPRTPYTYLGWLDMKDFVHEIEPDLVNRDIVAGLILQGVAVQYRNMGEWFDVQPNTLTVSMIGRLDFRVKPLTTDYYGNEVPATVDVMKTKVKTVWGISLNNNKIYPCAIGTARVNKSKGHGLYWETESQAQQVFDILMKPFKEVK